LPPVAIAAGGHFSLALKNDGNVVIWGQQTTVPDGVTNVTAIAAGWAHSIALKADGTVIAWGDNSSGQTNIPAGLSNVLAVAAGDDHCMALKSDGTIQAWGLNYAGEATVPAGLQGVSQIAAGGEMSTAIIPTLQISSLTLNGQHAALRFHTFSGRQYAVQFTPDFSPTNWQDIPGGSISGDGFEKVVTDTNATLNALTRFYRLRQN
jgi:hypothetical protein